MRDLTKDYRALSFFLLFLLWGSVILFNISSYTTHNSPSATQYEIEERFEQATDEKPPLEAFDPYRGPIVIGSDEYFIDNPIVFKGEGTESDPYMIRYWIVDIAQDGNNTGIHIANTTKYFEINEVQIENGTNGIKL